MLITRHLDQFGTITSKRKKRERSIRRIERKRERERERRKGKNAFENEKHARLAWTSFNSIDSTIRFERIDEVGGRERRRIEEGGREGKGWRAVALSEL